MSDKAITIEQDGSGCFNVHHLEKSAIGVSYDEMLGLVSAITMPDDRPCLKWLKTKEETAEWDKKYGRAI